MKTNIYCVSNSLKSFDENTFTTSSVKYEYSFAVSLSRYSDVIIFSKSLPFGENYNYKNIALYGVGNDKVNLVYNILKYMRDDKNKKILVFWGYDLINVISMKAIQLFSDAKVVPFVYDSHKEAIKYFTLLKKKLANEYFEIGKRLIKSFDGAILFQEKAANLLKINKEYIVTKPGINATNKNVKYNYKKDLFTVLFAGSLTYLNGIPELLTAFHGIQQQDIELAIYGDGPLVEMVNEYTKKDIRIKYYGVVTEEELQKRYRQASILLNLRHIDDECMSYAFPSKLFEIINTATPVITTKILDDKELLNYLCVLDDLNAVSVRKAIICVKENSEFYTSVALEAAKHVQQKYQIDRLCDDVHEYFIKISG